MIDLDQAIEHARCNSCNSDVRVRTIAFGPHGAPLTKTIVYCCIRCLAELRLQIEEAGYL